MVFKKIVSYLLLVMLVMYFITGFAMTRQFGFDHIMSRHLAHTIHLNMTIPFVILIILHVFIYIKSDIKKLFKSNGRKNAPKK